MRRKGTIECKSVAEIVWRIEFHDGFAVIKQWNGEEYAESIKESNKSLFVTACG